MLFKHTGHIHTCQLVMEEVVVYSIQCESSSWQSMLTASYMWTIRGTFPTKASSDSGWFTQKSTSPPKRCWCNPISSHCFLPPCETINKPLLSFPYDKSRWGSPFFGFVMVDTLCFRALLSLFSHLIHGILRLYKSAKLSEFLISCIVILFA
jgi:hypothetical protein